MNARDVIRRLVAAGWREIAQKGSHKQFKHATLPGKVTIPDHGSRDLTPGVLASIERQSGVSMRG